MITLSDNDLRNIHDTIDIWHRVYPHKTMDDITLAYKYYANPERLDEPVLFCIDEKDNRVGTIWNTGIHIVRSGQERYRSAQSGDAMMLPESRGLAFLRGFRAEADHLLKQGIDFRLGNPNEMAFPVSTRLGDIPVVELCNASLAVGPEGLGFPDLPSGLDYDLSERAPFSPDDYETMNAKHGRYCVERSAAYYAWRMDNRPAKCFSYHRLSDGGMLLGYIVLQENMDHCAIVDWGVYADDMKTSTSLLKALLTNMPLADTTLSVACLNKDCGECDLFTNCGFGLHVNENGELFKEHVTVRPLVDMPDDSPLLSGENWLIRQSDLDYFLN